jgi:hypothetical protein
MNTSLTPPRHGLANGLARAFLAQRWLALTVVLHAAAAVTIELRYHVGSQAGPLLQGYIGSLLAGPVFALAGYALYVMLFIRPVHLLRHLGGALRAHLSRARLVFALPALLLLPVFISSFTLIKAAVPLLRPYAWDRQLAAFDQALHGGVQPWVWLQGLLGHPLLTATLNLAYHLWFFIMLALLYWMVFCAERAALRMQFLLSFVLSWALLGNVMAIMFSSVGPCYYGLTQAGDDPYAGLLHYLQQTDREVPLLALRVQALLWQDYQQHSNVSGLAIAAMPSMHVASATLLALLGWRLNRAAGVALTVFAVLILLGSVHLGWHYAVDGYAGALGAALLWTLVGRLQARAAVRQAPRHVWQHGMGGHHG